MNPEVRYLFKQLVYMGKDYPAGSGGYPRFISIVKHRFRSTPINTTDELKQALQKGDYIIKELEALYFLQRYRYLKRTYSKR